MQSYLEDYPGARSHPEFKFVRAVQSFLTQQHEDKELVIVSDGCDKTQQIYEMIFSHLPHIKFVRASREGASQMYEKEHIGGATVTKYRGAARNLGVQAATGEIVTYMDSDDVILSHRLSDLAADWSDKAAKYTYASNPLRWIHSSAASRWSSRVIKGRHRDLSQYGLGAQGAFSLNMSVEHGYVLCATYAMSHRREISAQWRDCAVTVAEGGAQTGNSEDVDFYDQLSKTGSGFRQESDAYVVCHYRGLWDL
jgi:glycosyltransferase involved in cell wall biosynthesis